MVTVNKTQLLIANYVWHVTRPSTTPTSTLHFATQHNILDWHWTVELKANCEVWNRPIWMQFQEYWAVYLHNILNIQLTVIFWWCNFFTLFSILERYRGLNLSNTVFIRPAAVTECWIIQYSICFSHPQHIVRPTYSDLFTLERIFLNLSFWELKIAVYCGWKAKMQRRGEKKHGFQIYSHHCEHGRNLERD